MMTAQRTLESVKRTAATERAAIPGADKAVAANANGDDMYKAGKTYFSTGDYAKANTALQKALAKGGVSKADDARMLAGIALSRSGRKADAVKAFDSKRSRLRQQRQQKGPGRESGVFCF